MSLNPTGIEWTHVFGEGTGYTWNPITGCARGCDYCYARALVETRLNDVYPQGFAPTFWPERLRDVTPKQKPRGIFVGSMGDMWDPAVPQEWRDEVFDRMVECDQHIYFTLTKQPQNMTVSEAEGFEGTGVAWNLWQGVTHEDNPFGHLLRGMRTPAHTFVSFEPLLGAVDDLSETWAYPGYTWPEWFIVGADSRPASIAHETWPEWVEFIAREAEAYGIPLFAKNNLARVMGAEWVAAHQQWPEELQKLREEAKS